MYSLNCGQGEEKKTGKGIQRAYLKNHVTHADYRRCLLSDTGNILRSKRGKVKDKKWYDGKMIAVKWILELEEWDEDGALDVANIERFKLKRNKDGSFKK
eukprot:COSAG05_NODE_6883_length_887_cov_1.947970_2_plen_99_part_01